jgi:hypothetical protein
MMDEGPALRTEVRALRDEIVGRWHRDRDAIVAAVDAQLERLGRVPARPR